MVTKQCGLASHHKRNIQSACKSNISAAAVSGTCKHQLLAFFYKDCPVHRKRLSVQHRCQVTACHRNNIITGKSKRWSDESHLQRTFCHLISNQQIGNMEGMRIHSSGGRYAKCLVSESSFILNGCQDSSVFNCYSHIMSLRSQPLSCSV